MQYRQPKTTSYQLEPEPGTLVVEDITLRHGFIQIPRLLLFARNVSRDAKILYAILLGYAWQEGRCFPGYAKLCEDMQASENMVRKYMRELEEVEIIAQKRRGLGKTNIYTIRDLRTSKIEVQEHNKTEVTEQRKSEVKLETDYLETEELEISNIRKAKPEEKRVGTERTGGTKGEGNPIQESYPTRGNIRGTQSGGEKRGKGGFSTIGDSIARSQADGRQRPPKKEYEEDRQVILEYVEDFAREFSDQAPLKSSTSRAYKLYQQSGLSVGAFISRMQQARSVTKESSSQIKNETQAGGSSPGSKDSKGGSVYPLKRKMAYFFAVLEDQLGFREGGKADQRKVRNTGDVQDNDVADQEDEEAREGGEEEGDQNNRGYRSRYYGSGS